MKKIFTKILLIFLLILVNFLDSFSIERIDTIAQTSTTDKLIVKFFDVGDGDCTFIKYGDTDILVDTGYAKKDFNKIKKEFSEKIEDGILEYVFMTHGDNDHIGNSVNLLDGLDYQGENLMKDKNGSNIKIDTLVDFDTEISEGIYTSNIYKNYISKRDEMYKNNQLKYFSIDQFYNNNKDKKINLSNTSDCYLKVLDNKFYTQQTKNSNNLSICLLFVNGKSKVLLTGDLEKEGEDYLVQTYANNESENLKNITVFKAGHHGSDTSNTKGFIDMISPENVMITCNAGGKKYNFPKQASLDNFLNQNANVYISSYTEYLSKDEREQKEYYGDVTFSLDNGGKVEVDYSNKDIEKKITDTAWYKSNRDNTFRVRFIDGFMDKKNNVLGNCTLVEYQDKDILVDCGNYGTIGSNDALKTKFFVEEIKRYCTDGVLEYVLVTSPMVCSISQLVDSNSKNGIFSSFEIENIVDFGDSFDPSNCDTSKYSNYIKARDTLVSSGTKYYSASKNMNTNIEIDEGLIIDIMNHQYYEKKDSRKFDSFMSVVIEFLEKKFLVTGDVGIEGEKSIIANNKLDNVVLFKANQFGGAESNSLDLLNTIGSKNLHIIVNTTLNENVFGKSIMPRSVCDRLINNSKGVYAMSEKTNNGDYRIINNDMVFSITPDGETFFESHVTKLQDTEYYKNLL